MDLEKAISDIFDAGADAIAKDVEDAGLGRGGHEFVSWHFVALLDVVLFVVIVTKVLKNVIYFVTFVYRLRK